MFEKFTDQARAVLNGANTEAIRFNHEYIGTEHVLLSLINRSNATTKLLQELGIDPRQVRLEVEKAVPLGPEMVNMGKLPLTPLTKKAIEHAIEEARYVNQHYVGVHHLLLGLLRAEYGVAAEVLTAMKLTPEVVREKTMSMSTHVYGLKLPDDKWKQMKAVWDACGAAGVGLPSSVEKFFQHETPDEKGWQLINLDQHPSVSTYTDEDMTSGFEVDVTKLPAGVTTIRFINSF